MSNKYPLHLSFSHAFDGIKAALKQEPNFRGHAGFAVLAALTGLYLHISIVEWLVLLLTVALVLIMELINTAVEALIDIISPELRPKAKFAKDVSAAGVLLAATVALGVGALMFLPKIVVLLQR